MRPLHSCPLILGIAALLPGLASAQALRSDPGFDPQLDAVVLSSREVRPGDLLSIELRFRNDGTRSGQGDYNVFLHFESPEPDCGNIVFQFDHIPTEPTSTWQPGQIISDGPHVLRVPADRPNARYWIHVGLFNSLGGERLLDTYEGGVLTVTPDAPASETLAPAPLAPDILTQRRQALADRIAPQDRLSVSIPQGRFDLDRTSGAWAITDADTGALWTSCPLNRRFARITLRSGDRSATFPVVRFDEAHASPAGLRLISHPTVDGQQVGLTVTFTVTPADNLPGFRIAYESSGDSPWRVDGVSLLDSALGITEAQDSAAYVPERLGVEVRPDEGVAGQRAWRTYDNLSMAMFGLEADGSALLVNWEDVDTTLAASTTWLDNSQVPGARLQTHSLGLRGPAGYCTIHPLGKGSYVRIAHAYRALARAKGWLQTWADKRRRFPTVDRMFGATDFKPFVYWGKGVGFTFDEVAQCAEHWRNDLGIDRAFVVMAGWIEGGYDVRHPDILPAAAACGGNEGLAAAFRRIRDCGYLVGMHDNYQDMYEDAPSFDVKYLNKDPNGTPRMGGFWNGGQAWQVCAIKQVELAQRDATNIPEVDRLFDPSIYFIDTVFAWPLVTCEDPAHPMTRADDLRWKTRLCNLAKEHFGMFGSEEGREWAVACADYLEGIFGHQTDTPVGGVIPLFPLVYSDCVQLMTHQGSRINPGDDRKVSHHILFAEMPVAGFGEHLYWQVPEGQGLPIAPLPPVVNALGDRRCDITYRWRVDGPVPQDMRVFVHFTHAAATRAEGIAFQGDHQPSTPTSQWQPGTIVEDGPWTVEVPAEFDGPVHIMAGFLHENARMPLAGTRMDGGRVQLGTLDVRPTRIAYQPPPEVPPQFWARADGGWADGMCAADRITKNTWEVLSPLNVITAERRLDSHEFLNPERTLQRTRFGDLTITVNFGPPTTVGGVELPTDGFIAQSPTFLAFLATRRGNISYPGGALFTARSLDERPLSRSSRIRVYHGFGDPRIEIAGAVHEVPREAEVSAR